MKHLKVLLQLTKQSLQIEMEFRQHFFIRLITNLLYVVLQIALVEIFYQFTDSIGQWSKNEVYVLIGIFRIVEGVFHIFVYPNLTELPEQINHGELDTNLSKPVNSLFLSSLRMHQPYEISTVLTGVVILGYALPSPNLFTILQILALTFLGLVSLYSFMVVISSLSFYVSKLTAIYPLWETISRASRFPIDAFSSSRQFMAIAAPFFLIATLPAQIILGKVSMAHFVLEVLGATAVFTFAYRFWNHSLRRYSSASS